tara:strand:+ start:256 stop:774 length:519 start_codon:yes stop_codon:yes gene_type:complete
MAGTLTVQNIEGPSSGANANKVILNTGQTLYAPGHVVQVVQATYATETVSGSGSFTDTGLSVSITPTSTSSKVLVMVNVASSGVVNNGGADARGNFRIERGGSTILGSDIRSYDYGNSGSILFGAFFLSFLDSPASTSALTYKLQQQLSTGASIRVCEGNNTIAMQAMEIAQ